MKGFAVTIPPKLPWLSMKFQFLTSFAQGEDVCDVFLYFVEYPQLYCGIVQHDLGSGKHLQRITEFLQRRK